MHFSVVHKRGALVKVLGLLEVIKLDNIIIIVDANHLQLVSDLVNLQTLQEYGINIDKLETKYDPDDVSQRQFIVDGDFYKHTREQLRARLGNYGALNARFVTEGIKHAAHNEINSL